ncbi:MAG TPA: ATP-binding cassette domain-containing protein, partial [Coleofasciculaceae cyanobacterium]
MTAIVETQELTRRFGKTTAVNALNLTVEAGEVFGLLGHNGAGKSTMIKMLTTLLPPTSGRARVAQFDIVRHPARVRRVIGYVPQALSVDSTLTGYENLLIIAKLYDIPRAERASRLRGALAYVGLEDVAGNLVRSYSGGMIRRLEIAQAFIHRPRVLFLDEPTVGLDPVARKAVWDLVKQLCVDYGTTVFLTTHFMEEADNLCDRLAIMHQGEVVAMGTSNQLKASLNQSGATLDDVFIHYTGDYLTSGGNYRDT